MIMRINHMWGYQGWEDLEWWACARAKENMTTRHRWRPRCRIAHGWKMSESFVSQQCDILPCTFIFLSLDSSLSYLSCHSSSLFLLFFNHSLSFSHTHIFIIFFFSFFFLSFPYTYFSLYFSLSWHLFLSFQSSQLLSLLHEHNLNFKEKPC
jgi:hypothetical protein